MVVLGLSQRPNRRRHRCGNLVEGSWTINSVFDRRDADRKKQAKLPHQGWRLSPPQHRRVAALKHSPYIKVTLDMGHFTAFGDDAVKFVREHHERMANLHLKDRLRRAEDRNDENTPEWGKGDAPITQGLQLMKKEKYTFAGCIEYEYAGKGTAVEEVQKCLEYAKRALTA